MEFGRRVWRRLRLALWKRAPPTPRLPFDLDEFAELLSSRDPAALKQLAAGLSARIHRPAAYGLPALKQGDRAIFIGKRRRGNV
jgi:hypothetical protein